MSEPLKCRECGKEFVPSNPYQKICSDKCRVERSYKRGREGNIKLTTARKALLAPIPCKTCGVVFKPKKRVVKYCSAPCAYQGTLASNRKARERTHRKPLVEIKCNMCGKPFIPSGARRKNCSDECTQKSEEYYALRAAARKSRFTMLAFADPDELT
jgi:hypothetical protein